jgi:hypothetical protein
MYFKLLLYFMSPDGNCVTFIIVISITSYIERDVMVQVFTTCGSAAKKAVLLERFPQLDTNKIGDSRSTSFEQLVMQAVSYLSCF